jgi:hypothetical protein
LCELEEKALRLGCTVDEKITPRAFQRKLDQYVEKLQEIVGDDGLIDSIINSRPRPYPTTKPMDGASRRKHAMWGRRFEIEQLCIQVGKCDCCGTVKPYAADPWLKAKWFDGNTHFHRLHLTHSFYPARKCECASICGGEQFWCKSKKAQRETFLLLHPDDDANKWESNTTLCQSCYDEKIDRKYHPVTTITYNILLVYLTFLVLRPPQRIIHLAESFQPGMALDPFPLLLSTLRMALNWLRLLIGKRLDLPTTES